MRKKLVYLAALLTIAWGMSACTMSKDSEIKPPPTPYDTIVPPNNPSYIWTEPIRRDSLRRIDQGRTIKQKVWEGKINTQATQIEKHTIVH